MLFVGGYGIATAAGRDLGVAETSGFAGELRTDGWNRFSRNPQYVGYIAATVGFPLMTDAALVPPLAGTFLIWWFLFPLSEEPWLREQYGDHS